MLQDHGDNLKPLRSMGVGSIMMLSMVVGGHDVGGSRFSCCLGEDEEAERAGAKEERRKLYRLF